MSSFPKKVLEKAERKVSILNGNYRKSDTLFHHFVTAREELKEIHQRYDEVVSETAKSLKGELRKELNKLFTSKSKPSNEVVDNVIKEIWRLEDILVDAEQVQKDLEDAISAIVGLELQYDEAKQVLEIMEHESKQLNHLYTKGRLLRQFAENLKQDTKDSREQIQFLKENYEELLVDFSILQDDLKENTILLDKLFKALEEGVKVTAKYKQTGKV